MALLDTILQSVVLSVFSNVLAQIISAYQEQKPLFNINPAPIAQFIVYTVVNVPINWYWQDFLEYSFPSNVPATSTDGKSAEKPPTTVFSVRNTLIKFAMDQTVGAAFNIPLFLATIGLAKGQSFDQISHAIQRDAIDIYYAGLKLWPAVSLLSFSLVPVQHRVIFGSVAGVVWNIYLSLMAK